MMDLVLTLAETLGEAPTAALFGLITGTIFGIAAQRSRFCLRAATVEFARRSMGDKVAVWLLTFSTAVVWVQGAYLLGYIDVPEARMMAVPGSWSGAILGGLLFGVGMVLARGCSGRLLVLAATGNLRSLVSGLIFAVVAQMSLSGWLAPMRDHLAGLWITSGGRNTDLLSAAHLPHWGGLALGLVLALVALDVARRNRIGAQRLIFGAGVGFAIAAGWALTTALSRIAFDPVQIESATFTGPSANTLMFFLDNSSVLSFDIGLVPGVFLGAFLASIIARDFRFQGFENEANMRRAFAGQHPAEAHQRGAGEGGSIFAGTAWAALTAMWVGGMITDYLVDQKHPGAVPA